MKASLQDITAVKKRFFVEIESAEVDKKLNEAYGELRKKAKIPGFRPGKAPRKILETRFGDQVTEDVTRSLINETFPKAIEEVKAFPVSAPVLENEPVKQGCRFKYSMVMEVRPQFEVKDYLGLEVEKVQHSITEEDLEKELDRIRRANGKLVSIDEDRPIQKDDYVTLDYEGFEGGDPLDGINASNFLLNVGSHDFHPQFEERLIGLKKGENSKINVDFEDTYYHSRLAGKSVDFETRVVDIREMVVRELNDEFARGLGADFNDLQEFKNEVRDSMIAREKLRVERETKQGLLKQISDSVDFELPQSLVESEIDYTIENVRQYLLRSGSNLEKSGLSEEKLRKDYRAESERRVKGMLVLAEIAESEEISISEEDVAEGFKELASSTGQDPASLREHYEATNRVSFMREKLLEEKTLNYLLEHANIKIIDNGEKKDNK